MAKKKSKLLEILTGVIGVALLGAISGITIAWVNGCFALKVKEFEAKRDQKKAEEKKPEAPKPKPKQAPPMPVFLALHDKAELNSPARKAFCRQWHGSIVNWDGYVQKEYDDGYSVSVEKDGKGRALVQFKPGEFEESIPKRSHISFEGIFRGDLSDSDDRVSIEEACRLAILAPP